MTDPKRTLPPSSTLVLVVLTVAAAVGIAGGVSSRLAAKGGAEPAIEETATEQAAPDILAVLGYEVTGGAAPGYVEDRACATCHADIWATYQEVAMSRSMTRPRPATAVEAFGEIFVHEASKRRYSMRFEDTDMIFRREQLDMDGRPINVIEQKVDWVVGSGNHSRVYFVRQDGGELFQLPLAWYAADASGQPARWGLAPGFDRADSIGPTRRVRRECMFCHNAYPDVPAGSDLDDRPHTFPAELPEGIGCQRCHGPGAAHSRMAFGGARNRDAMRAAITNPADLDPARRDDICFGCHLQPAAAMPAIRRFGHGIYSFRPGDDLADYQVQVDVEREGEPRDARFEINHHPYRLRQSTCFEASEGALSCLTCHDPHRKVPIAERAAHYRAACQSCHEPDACDRPEHRAGGVHAETGEGTETGERTDTGDCVACHMPPRRPSDVVQTVMTDHRIVRRFDAEALLAPMEEREPVITDIDFYWPDRAPRGDLGEIYRAAAVLRMGVIPSATDHLAKQLATDGPENEQGESESAANERRYAWRELGRASLLLGRYDHALDALGRALLLRPEDDQARMWQGLAHARLGDNETAIAHLEAGGSKVDLSPEAWFNLAHLRFGVGRLDEARAAAERAVTRRELFPTAWLLLGRIHARAGRILEAIPAFEKALAIDPRLSRAYVELSAVLAATDQVAEARRYLRHGIGIVPDPRALEEALAALPDTAVAGGG